MLYSEAGQFNRSYTEDRRLFRLRQESTEAVALVVVAFGVIPLIGDDYWFTAILVPFLILSLAGLGLNLLTGYAGQLSVGTAAFMSVGAYTAYNVAQRLPGVSLLVAFLAGGLVSGVLGVIAGLPSLRIKGFYLVVSSLALQFFVEWVFTRYRWFSNDNASGQVSVPPLVVFGQDFASPAGRYLLTLTIVALMTVLAISIVRSELGRRWMAVRDMETAAAVMGIPVLRAKLLAFGISSFYCGIAGALWGFTYLGTFDPRAWDLGRSFQVLFVIIIGGLGSIIGSYLGSAFILLIPILLSQFGGAAFGDNVDQGALENYKKILFGVLIVVVLIKEPGGIAKIWNTFRARARVWPLRQW